MLKDTRKAWTWRWSWQGWSTECFSHFHPLAEIETLAKTFSPFSSRCISSSSSALLSLSSVKAYGCPTELKSIASSMRSQSQSYVQEIRFWWDASNTSKNTIRDESSHKDQGGWSNLWAPGLDGAIKGKTFWSNARGWSEQPSGTQAVSPMVQGTKGDWPVLVLPLLHSLGPQ